MEIGHIFTSKNVAFEAGLWIRVENYPDPDSTPEKKTGSGSDLINLPLNLFVKLIKIIEKN